MHWRDGLTNRRARAIQAAIDSAASDPDMHLRLQLALSEIVSEDAGFLRRISLKTLPAKLSSWVRRRANQQQTGIRSTQLVSTDNKVSPDSKCSVSEPE
jgi:hypothetical protein